MRLGLLVLAAVVLAVVLPACSLFDGDPPSPAPGMEATVDDRPFTAYLTMGWAAPDTAAPLSISGATTASGEMEMILLTVPARVGTYSEGTPETSAGYSRRSSSETALQVWLAGEGAPGTDLEIRVTSVTTERAQGTFAFTARHVDDPSRAEVAVTDGSFSVSLDEVPDRRPGAILGAARAFDGARLSPAR